MTTTERESGREGLTLAGLLMFGKLRSILDAVPNYIVDYQEILEPRSSTRWTDRLTTDGSWSGNLFDFYRSVLRKIYQDLKVPFELRGAQRVDDSPVHEALREAMINTIVHADYTGRVSILVLKRPDMFGFRNPGTMRIPLEDAVKGGTSDCRNRNIQKMFQLVGIGEQSGSGIPKIYTNWREQHWRRPDLWEKFEPDQTLLAMRTVSLLPPETLTELRGRFGEKLNYLSDTQRLALATVAIEGRVSHARLKDICNEHPHDLTKALSALVRDGLLESAGVSKGTYYFFPGEPPAGNGDVLWTDAGLRSPTEPLDLFSSSEQRLNSSEQSKARSEQMGPVSSEHLEANSEQWKKLLKIAELAGGKKKAPKDTVRQAILALCGEQDLTLRDLAALLKRSPDTLRVHYLNQMVKDKELTLKFQEKPNHPNQAYRRANKEDDKK